MNVRRTVLLLLLCLVFVTPMARAASPNVVLSQVYGGGGASSGSPAYINDYVELFNTTSAPVVIGGWSLQYGSAAGNFGNSGSIFTFPAGTTIPANRYLTVKLGGAGTLGANFTADFTSTGLSMSATSGKVALANISTTLGCGTTPCTLPHANIVDLVSWGAANNGEGGTTVNNGTGLNSSVGAIRKSNGCQDTDNNNADFVVASTGGGLVPRTLASAPHTCGVTNNAPTINAVANPITTVSQDAAPFPVNLTGNDDGGIYNWSAAAGSGIAAVNVTGGQGTANVTYTVTLQAGFSGTASFTASLSDGVNAPATRAVNIAVTPIIPNNPPTITGFANPVATVAQDAAPFTLNFSGLDDNGIYQWSASTGTGVSSVAVTAGQGTANATVTVTLQAGFSGTAAFTVSLSDTVNPNVNAGVTLTVTPAPPPPLDHIVISQVYGGGGNAGATYRNDYVELYNPTTSAVDLGGWTIQYGSATGTSWQAQPLCGVMQPGEYYLISLASGGAVGALLPSANILGDINLSATNGKVALVASGDPLDGCVIGAPVVDLVGFGSTANCREGATNSPGANNTTALFRKNGGFTDSNVNGSDFQTGTPNPRRTTPISECGPYVLSTDPRSGASTAARDANITVNFTESVDLIGAWFDITCTSTGQHNDATLGGGGKSWIIVPNVNFQAGESCTVTIFQGAVHDTDLDDSAPNTDTLTADYSWTFTVATGTAPAYSADVHLTFGNPTDATADTNVPDNYLMEKPEFTLSYHRDRGIPNWVSWHLADEWVGTLTRVDTFRADPAVPADWYRVLGTDYQNSGFDRGHMVPNADRDKETSIPINQATFLMTNMIPQTADNNQGPWADMENDLRALLPANELYIVAGGAGTGGTGSNGFATTIANGHVTVPAMTWKAVLVILKAGGDDVSRVTAGTRTIAVIMPNIQGIRNHDWRDYLVSVDAVEALTGYDLFENLPDAIENAVEAGVNGTNPPGVAGQSVDADEDQAASITLEAASSSASVTYTIVSSPSHGILSGSGANQTYTPAPDYFGTDSFTYRASNGSLQSNVATVTITIHPVNDAPTAANDAKSTDEDTALQFGAAELTANDVTGPANENDQTLNVASVGGATNGAVSLDAGVVTYTPAPNYHGPASFTYEVCDNGGLCATGTVLVDVASVNDAPTVTLSAPSTGLEGTSVSASATVADGDGDSTTVTWSVTRNGSPYANGTGTSIAFTPDDNGSYVVSVSVTDGTDTASDAATIAVSNVAPVIGSVNGPSSSIAAGSPATVTVTYTDAGAADTHTATFTWNDGTTSTVACAAGTCAASRSYTAAGVYAVNVVVSDDDGGSAAATFESVIVTDANAGFVTGGGWILTSSGKANFNLNLKYQKNETAPKGNTKFDLAGGRLDSTSHDWLVVTAGQARLQGTGTINGSGNYGFLVTAVDGADAFAIRVWDKSNGAVVYDSGAPQPLAGGSIVIHK